MTINDIITRHFNELKEMLVDCEKISYDSLTDDDLFQMTMLKAIKKYGDQEIDEEEGLAYLKKDLNMNGYFKHKRKGDVQFVALEELKDFDIAQ